MEKEKEENIFKKRILELANTACYKDYPVCSDFLSLGEQTLLFDIQKQFPPVNYLVWGGNDVAERKMICFSNASIEREQFPIGMLKICPTNLKFAEKLSHRDYLGALLNLGVDRSKVGDIMFDEDIAYVYVEQSMTDFFCNNLEKVKHTKIKCEPVFHDVPFEQKYKEITGTVSSVRLDTIISIAFQSSRSKMLSLISGEKVYVNGILVNSNSYRLKEGDIVSVRGNGKFLYEREQGETKRGKIKVLLRKYI